MAARALAAAAANPNEGWAERRETFGCCASAPVGRAITRRVRRLRGALRPMTRDARLSALHRGGFRLPGPRFSPRYRPRLALRPAADRSQRAPRSQVVVPGGRGPYLPGQRLQAATAGRHSPLRLQDRLRRRPSMSEDANLCTMDAYCSQAQNVVVYRQSLHLSRHAIWKQARGSTDQDWLRTRATR